MWIMKSAEPSLGEGEALVCQQFIVFLGPGASRAGCHKSLLGVITMTSGTSYLFTVFTLCVWKEEDPQ